MPYIKQERREELNKIPFEHAPENAGELNFLISQMCQEYLINNGMNYQKCNDIIGALEGAKIEFYRRVVASYEDKKIKENGDVYYE